VLNKIDADPNLKNMYLNCISNTTGLSAYELLHQYWLGQNFNTKNGVMGDASGLVLNPTITGQLSLNDQDSTITINSKYQLSPENYGLTMTGTAIDDNIINVTFTYDDTFPT
jgi:hypothetical protein